MNATKVKYGVTEELPATKVKYGVTEGLPMMHTRDAMLILGEMQHHQLSLRSNSGHPNRPLGGLRAECTELSRQIGRAHV